MDIKKFYNNIFQSLNNLGKNNKISIKPIYYWKTAIFIFLSGFILISALNLYFFKYLNKIEIREEVKEENRNNIIKSDFQEVLDDYNNKKTKFNELLNSMEVMDNKNTTTSATP